ncbi:TetR/AcrR family transcriptional regulator [Streptomyces avicenniae]|uniref:TetR/AcrR family transcriptional regulator n=1 Tax=Streptomyces avicenniae TaxID=500153 RepID=UPI00069A91B0|nr:TetR family transcriptional regulator [Streptomyces avicenniae]
MAAAARRARRHDPDRRERIVDAAVRVVERDGIAALSHRAVAAEADVPLGSTTYHFTDLDALLTAALERVNDGWLGWLAAWLGDAPPDEAPADAAVRLIDDCLGPRLAQTRLEYELYFAGLTRPVVRPLAARCLDDMAVLVRPLAPDEATARAVVALLDGLLIQLMLTGRPHDPGQTRAAFARLVPGNRTGSPRGPSTR